ncbi:Mhp366/Mhp367 family surface (lipo)protein [Mesomycoplasma dispar]|uniref:DUF31 domain-containing protein n=1 Tax=Mesomycoplasma dispar TaxID=86660 RepID=A0ABN5DUJ3_9BACT|nr:hypothetical protein [Mesomycoplasma dispar]ATP59682.1 hypothetical protein CSW10_01890 [Mesomycoplasma dispar]
MKKSAKHLFILGCLAPFFVSSCLTQKEYQNPVKVKIEKNQQNTNVNKQKTDENKKNLDEQKQKTELNKKQKTDQNSKTDENSQDKKDAKTKQNNELFPKLVNKPLEEDLSFDFFKVNQNSIKNFNINSLSDINRSDFKVGRLISSNFQQYYLKNWEKVVKKENESTFLGQKNDDLNIYLLSKMNPNLVDNISAKANYYSYFNPNAIGNYYNLRWFGFKSDSLQEKRFADIFTRNLRFASGSAVFLNANSEKAAFLTNKHVIYPQNARIAFWKLMNKKVGDDLLNAKLIKFLQYYDDFKIKELDNRVLFRMWETKWLQDKGYPVLPHKYKNWKVAELDSFMENLYADQYFELADFENYGFDVAVFYFNYAKFIADVENLVKYFKDKGQNFINSIYSLANGKFDNFIVSFNEFKKYWQKISKFKPLKISERNWEDGDFDYTTKIGMFWANNLTSKNVFKGVNFRRDSENPRLISANFFAANGPGASGSGIFNADGSLAFLNRSILTVNGNVQSLFYDQFGLTSHLTSGIALKSKNYNLVSQIYKTYLKDEDEEEKTQ